MEQETAAVVEQPGCWTIDTFTRGAKISRGMYHALPEESKPKHVKLGKLVRIIESPTDWLRRMAARGGVQTRAAAA